MKITLHALWEFRRASIYRRIKQVAFYEVWVYGNLLQMRHLYHKYDFMHLQFSDTWPNLQTFV